jgi:hypothetical protein
LANFSIAQWRYSTAFEKYAVNQKSSSDYKFNPFIPCFMYFEGKFHILENEKLDEIQTLAREQLDANPRCVSARIILAQIYQGTGDMDALEYQVSQLLEIAPYRADSRSWAWSTYQAKRDSPQELGIFLSCPSMNLSTD